MHFSYILPFVAFGLEVANAAAIDDTNMLVTRAPKCSQGIELIRLQIKPSKSFTGVGKPGECEPIPNNVKDFDLNSDGTKSLLPCFDCTVYEHSDCSGSSETIEGNKEKSIVKGPKKQHWKSWKCVCKDSKDGKDDKDAKESKDSKDAKEPQESKESKDSKDAKEPQESKDSKN